MKNLLRNLFARRKSKPMPPPKFRTVHPDEPVSEYIWFMMFHVSCRWAKEYYAQTAVKKYYETIKA